MEKISHDIRDRRNNHKQCDRIKENEFTHASAFGDQTLLKLVYGGALKLLKVGY